MKLDVEWRTIAHRLWLTSVGFSVVFCLVCAIAGRNDQSQLPVMIFGASPLILLIVGRLWVRWLTSVHTEPEPTRIPKVVEYLAVAAALAVASLIYSAVSDPVRQAKPFDPDEYLKTH